MAVDSKRCRVGIVGYGSVGAYFVDRILNDASIRDKLELSFVWNRSVDKLRAPGSIVSPAAVLEDLHGFSDRPVDIVVELCHPSVAKAHGAAFLSHADLFVGSPTAFADADADAILRRSCSAGTRSVYVPVGALWGAQDLTRLAAQGQLSALSITMKKHPASLKLEGDLEVRRKAAEAADGEVVLYDGPVRELARLAPNNVNTMAAAAIACPGLGFDGVVGRLVSDRSLDSHVIEIDGRGPMRADGTQFRVTTTRVNPAPPGSVTGAATYNSFLASLLAAAEDCMQRKAAGGTAPGRVLVC